MSYYKPLPLNLTIKESTIEGLGLFAIQFIPIGTELRIPTDISTIKALFNKLNNI